MSSRFDLFYMVSFLVCLLEAYNEANDFRAFRNGRARYRIRIYQDSYEKLPPNQD